jgi:NAD(P)-dependent dehydrogenase (short-subunit alcohol dehydrogenase family)
MKIIVTGAASGIGRATAKLFAEKPHDGRPAELLLVDRDAPPLEAAVAELRNAGARVESVVADLGDPAMPAQVVAAAEREFGGIDVLVSNAGAIHVAPIKDLTLAEYDRLFAVNTRATLLLAQAAYPALKRARGAIVATASTAALHPTVPLGAYSASKAALAMFVQQIALEWGPDGIRCNCVSPGPTITGMTAHVYRDETLRKQRAAEIPLRRIGVPEDLAQAIHFLAGPGAAFITGVNLAVDGGLSTTLMVSRNSAAHTVGNR